MDSYNESNKDKVALNQIKTKNKYENIKSDYFLQIIFNSLNKKKTLEIIKYNKNIQQRLNLSINDIKNFSETYSSI